MEKLIRFDWAIKKLLRNKVNFDILEGFLTAILHEDVTILNILESESNREDEDDKFTRVDLLVENTTHDLIIIEVQVKSEYDFFHRIAYSAARLLTEHLEKGQAYKQIKKVISISITYFTLGTGTDYLYYGSTNFVGVHTQDVLALAETQAELFRYTEVKKIFPEYYLIRVGKFSDEIHEALDEWIYMLKHNDVKPEFSAKNIQHASEKLQVMKLGEEQRKAYEEFIQNVSYQESMLWSAREEGRFQEKAAIVKNLLTHGVDLTIIQSSTGLSVQEIQRIQEGRG